MPLIPAFRPLAALLALATATLTSCGAADGRYQILGGDVSALPLIEARNGVYRDADGPGDALVLMRKHGLTCVRLRLWTSTPEQAKADPVRFGCDLATIVPLAQRAKRAGLRVLLDFHYSDTWTDPGHQRKPTAWQDLSFPDLVARMEAYTRDSIAAFAAADALPDYVQIGNEIPMGMLWPDGKVDADRNWPNLAALIRAADRGIATGAGRGRKPKTVIHLDRGANWTTTKWFFDNLITEQQVDFDIIGQSYYPFLHGTRDELRDCLIQTVDRYGKPVLIAETAFPWDPLRDGKPQPPLGGIAAGPDGQVAFVRELGRILAALPADKALGVVWWGSEYQTSAAVPCDWFDHRSFWNDDGRMLPVVDALAALGPDAGR